MGAWNIWVNSPGAELGFGGAAGWETGGAGNCWVLSAAGGGAGAAGGFAAITGVRGGAGRGCWELSNRFANSRSISRVDGMLCPGKLCTGELCTGAESE